MTTRVIIDPANHLIEVIIRESHEGEAPRDEAIILERHAPSHTLWLHSHRSIVSIREIPEQR